MIATAPSQRIDATLTAEVHVPKMTVREWRAFVCKAPDLPSQTEMSTSVSPEGVLLHEASPLRRPLFFLRLPSGTPEQEHTFRFTATYRGVLWARRLVPYDRRLPRAPVAALSDAEQEMSLAASGRLDFTHPDFQRWLAKNVLRRQQVEGPVDFARRTFLFLQSRYGYVLDTDQDKHASKLCQADKSDCVGLSLLYAAALRANQIPARVLFGRGAEPGTPSRSISHAIAEFYVEGVGWVPVDVSYGVGSRRPGGDLKHFGFEAGRFLATHAGTDLELEAPGVRRRTASSVQTVYWIANGPGSTEGARIRPVRWDVRILPLGSPALPGTDAAGEKEPARAR